MAFGCSHSTCTPGEVACKDEFLEGMCRIREKRRTRSSRPPKSDSIVSSETGVQAIHGESYMLHPPGRICGGSSSVSC